MTHWTTEPPHTAARASWDEYFSQLAALVATRSKDRNVHVGAIVVDDAHQILATGYNGFAAGLDDDRDDRHERPAKYLWTCHAEENAILSAARRGVSLLGGTLYATHAPCARCARGIIQVGIGRVSAPADVGAMSPATQHEIIVGRKMLIEANVTVV